jgi:predicted alpha/beta hydrolase
VGGFTGTTRRKLAFLCAMIPPVSALLGYYPGDKLGFGGREARTLMQDWRALAKTNRYQANGFSDDLDCGIAQYSGPVLSLSLADDPFAPPASVDAVVDKFIAASVSNVLLDEQTLGDRADHFRWVRSPAATVEQIICWHEKQQSRT